MYLELTKDLALLNFLSELAQNQRKQLEILEKQQEMFSQWFKMMTEAPEGLPTYRPAAETDIIEALEMAAEDGDMGARDIIASPEALQTYLRSFRSA